MAGQRIHILGASGSGVTTLGRALAARLGCPCFDCDDYFWLPTDPPYQVKRERAQRQELLLRDLSAHDSWVLSGSACGWGDVVIPLLDAVVYLRLPTAVRLERIRRRERERFGDEVLPGGTMHAAYRKLMDYAALYDTGDEGVRSRRLHERWLSGLSCKVIRIEEDLPVGEKVRTVLRYGRV
jgi:adenylate kinase family enzyme